MKVFGSCFCGLDEPKVICLHVRQALVHILAILLELQTLSSFNLPKLATKSFEYTSDESYCCWRWLMINEWCDYVVKNQYIDKANFFLAENNA